MLEARLLAAWFPPEGSPPGRLSRWLASRVAREATRRRAKLRRLPPGERPLVVVVGNLVVGGTGKTPLVAELARELAARGWAVGILARGHRARRRDARLVGAHDDAREHGDEPVMLAAATGLPVACGHDRGAALALLRRTHPGLALVISDDGMQHGRLPRSLELAVFDGRGAGNGAVLPAGPLREPLEHLATMDALLWRDDEVEPRLPEGLVLPPRRFGFHLEAAGWRPVAAPDAAPIQARAFAARLRGQPVHALAGIARPERFFATVRACGIALDHAHALPDHVVVGPGLLPAAPATVLMTAKDAVKFTHVADDRCWFLEMRAHLDPALPDWLEELLRGSPPD